MKSFKFQYEEKYKKWLKMNPSTITKKVMHPVRRGVVVCLPKCVDTALSEMTEDEANQIIDSFVYRRLEEIIALLLGNLAAKQEGGKENGKIQN